MLEIQKFALANIYCAPFQDRKFSFKMVRVNKPSQPFKRKFNVFNIVKNLPDETSSFHIFIIGHLNPHFLDLLLQQKEWFRDVWVKVSSDMVERNFIFKVYNQDGVLYPRDNIYYSFIDESTLLIALRTDYSLKTHFDIESFKYLQVYSNSYFQSNEYGELPVQNGIKYSFSFVYDNANKVALQNQKNLWESNGGKTLIYVNGYYTDDLTLNIPDNSYVELVYDQSIISKEAFVISSLRTFDSIKDNKLKYFLFRDTIIDRIQYVDDNEIYIEDKSSLVTKGLFFYEHADYAVRNVTDKDYGLYTSFVINQAQTLTNLTTGAVSDKYLTLYTRKSGLSRPNIYSTLKLNELYKLPQDKELDVLTNVNYTLSELRADTLENSDYFKVASANPINQLTRDLCTSAVGYNGITYYFAKTPVLVSIPVTIPPTTTAGVDVPFVYQEPSSVFEYDNTGKYVGSFRTTGPMYVTTKPNVKYVDFIYGVTPNDFGSYLSNGSVFTLLHNEYKVISAVFTGVTRITNWVDITTDITKVNIIGNDVTINVDDNTLVKVVYLNQPNIYDLELDMSSGNLYFPIMVKEDRGTGTFTFPADVPYTNIELFLNGYRLVYNLDYFVDFPNISICNKTYIDYTLPYQKLNIRAYGFTLDKTQINKTEVNGFINNGVLTRNNYYDIRDDRVFSVYIGGKLYNRDNIAFAELDNTVRTVDPLNGLPYSVSEPFIPVKSITGIDTIPIYLKNIDVNKKISQLFNVIYPEPGIGTFDIIADRHIIYSPTVSNFINDILLGVIPSSVYTTPYNDSTIIGMLDNAYKGVYALDPIRFDLPDNLVTIQPHLGNSVINLNLHAYRFIANLIRIITKGRPNLINVSGYLNVTT